MFGLNKNKKNRESNRTGMLPKTVGSTGLNSLSKGTTVEGSITADNDIRIDGKIKGTLVCKAKVIVGPNGVIEGEVRCQNAMIEGCLEGKITVSELLNVRETAKINGEVKTSKLIVQTGAEFNVTCVMSSQQPMSATAAGHQAGKDGRPKEAKSKNSKATV